MSLVGVRQSFLECNPSTRMCQNKEPVRRLSTDLQNIAVASGAYKKRVDEHLRSHYG